ncbi:MAG: adenylate/guanylate cyclase domain-containing protein [Synechocystis sp.]
MAFLVQNPDKPHPVIHSLQFGPNAIGRDADNGIVIADNSLSRRHAELIVTPNAYWLRDLGSLNRSFVNNQPIQNCQIYDGDRLRFGRAECQFYLTLPASLSPPPETPSEGWSIVSQLSPQTSETALKSLLIQDQPTEKLAGTILNLRPQSPSNRAEDKLKILLAISREFSTPQKVETLLDKILELLFQIMNVDRGVILLKQGDSAVLESAAIRFRPGIAEDPNFFSKTIVRYVQDHGNAIVTADALNDHRFQASESILQQVIHASMCVPLKPREDIIGLIYVDNLSLTNIYAQEDLEFLTSLANQAAIAIENAQLYQKIQMEAVMRSKLERFFPHTVRQKLREKGGSLWDITDTEVTILFADISSYTALSSQRSPREIITFLNQYFTVMVEEIIFPLDGTLEKYVGDALLACWGAPYAQPDDTNKAVQAAIAMQKAVQRLNQHWKMSTGLEIAIHIGLNTGHVAAGNIGSQELIQYAVIGDTTNVCSRICSAAQSGEILLAESTVAKLSPRAYPLEALPPVTVKGKDSPLQLYSLAWHLM